MKLKLKIEKQSPISFRSAASARHNFIETSSVE